MLLQMVSLNYNTLKEELVLATAASRRINVLMFVLFLCLLMFVFMAEF